MNELVMRWASEGWMLVGVGGGQVDAVRCWYGKVARRRPSVTSRTCYTRWPADGVVVRWKEGERYGAGEMDGRKLRRMSASELWTWTLGEWKSNSPADILQLILLSPRHFIHQFVIWEFHTLNGFFRCNVTLNNNFNILIISLFHNIYIH